MTHRSFSNSFDSTTANILTTALTNNLIVTALVVPGRGVGHGLVHKHIYTVLGFNAATQMVHLRNPHGSNLPYTTRVWRPATLDTPAGFRNEARPALGLGAADFWLPLADFSNWFASMNYEH